MPWKALLPASGQAFIPKLVAWGFLFELVNLFGITVTEGYLQFPPFPLERFASFEVHATLAWLLLATLYFSQNRRAARDRKLEKAAELLVVGLCFVGARLYFEHGVRLSADSPHYFVQARSILFDQDLDFENDYAEVRPRDPVAPRYPVGLALLSLPFLAAAHAFVQLAVFVGHDLEATGFGYPYETAFELSGYFFASLALVALLRVVSRLFSLGLALLGLLTAWLSSFLVWYMVIDLGMPHAMSFAWSTFFLCFWLAKRPVPDGRELIVLGALIGIAATVRWQNGVLILLPLVDLLLHAPRALRGPVRLLGAAAVAFAPQWIFWLVTAGSPLALPTEGHDVAWTQMHVSEVLYSTNRGLFPWNPALYLGVLGLILWLREKPRLAALFLLGFGLEVYVNSTVGIWWAGWSYGGRRFDSCFLFFVVGLAFLFEFLRRRPLVPIVFGSVALVLWNVGLIEQSRKGDVPPDRLVSFRDVSRGNLDRFYARFGFPFAAPANWLFAGRYDVSPEKFDHLFGHEGFGHFRLTFDATSTPYLARSWSEPERDGAGEWFRWSTGLESSVLVPLKSPRSYELLIDVRPFAPATPNGVGVRVNGMPQQTRPISAPSTLRWVLGPEVLRAGMNVLSFRFDRVVRPSDIGPSGDSRELAVGVYRLSLLALPD